MYDTKSFSFLAEENTYCDADFEESKRVLVSFKFKVEPKTNVTEDNDGYEFQCKTNFVSTNFYINNSSLLQGTTYNNFTEAKFSNDYLYGYTSGLDKDGETVTIEDSYSWQFTADISSKTTIYFRTSLSSVSIYYPKLDKTVSSSGSSSADKELVLKSGDESSYTQTINLGDYYGRFSFVLEITVQEI